MNAIVVLAADVLMTLWDSREWIMIWTVIVVIATLLAIAAIGFANSEGFR